LPCDFLVSDDGKSFLQKPLLKGVRYRSNAIFKNFFKDLIYQAHRWVFRIGVLI
jgi:hypothetical protein